MSEVGGTIKEIAKFRIGKLLLNIIMLVGIIVIVYSTIYHFIRCYKGKNSTLFWGMAECKVCERNETDTVVKRDTVYVKETPVVQQVAKKILSLSNKINKSEQKIEGGSSGIQNNGSINNGQQAGRDINNYGIIPRKIVESNLINFFTVFPDRSVRIAFKYYGSEDAEMISVKKQIDHILRKKGYVNIGIGTAKGMASNMPSEIFFEVQPDSSVYICIPPNQ